MYELLVSIILFLSFLKLIIYVNFKKILLNKDDLCVSFLNH